MNPAIKIDAKKDLVAPHTEHVFNDEFWSGLDLVCNALDNMEARFYVDKQYVAQLIQLMLIFIFIYIIYYYFGPVNHNLT